MLFSILKLLQPHFHFCHILQGISMFCAFRFPSRIPIQLYLISIQSFLVFLLAKQSIAKTKNAHQIEFLFGFILLSLETSYRISRTSFCLVILASKHIILCSPIHICAHVYRVRTQFFPTIRG